MRHYGTILRQEPDFLGSGGLLGKAPRAYDASSLPAASDISASRSSSGTISLDSARRDEVCGRAIHQLCRFHITSEYRSG
jgi:hypothetical protein